MKIFKTVRAMIDTEQYGWAGQFRWPLLSIIVGIIAGLGAILFEESLRWTFSHFIQIPTGYTEPRQGAEAHTIGFLTSVRMWVSEYLGQAPCRQNEISLAIIMSRCKGIYNFG